jgi:hypothetical protein
MSEIYLSLNYAIQTIDIYKALLYTTCTDGLYFCALNCPLLFNLTLPTCTLSIQQTSRMDKYVGFNQVQYNNIFDLVLDRTWGTKKMIKNLFLKEL